MESIFIPYTLPGEVVTAEIRGERGRPLDIIEASPDRVAPPCPYFGRCGGCALQHADPVFVADWKRELVVTALRHKGVEIVVSPTLDAHGEGRRRATLHVRRHGGRWLAGFMQSRSDRLEAVEHCLVLAPALADAPELARDLAAPLTGHGTAFEVAFTATDTGLDVAISGRGDSAAADDLEVRTRLADLAGRRDVARLTLGGEIVAMRHDPALRIGDARAVLPTGGFLQATAAGEAELFHLIGAPLRDARRIADLFAGIGPFALRLAGHARVHAVDSDANAIASLARAAGQAGFGDVTSEVRDLFRRPLSAVELEGFDAVLFDPPRAGAEAQARELAQSAVPLVVAVACDPASFARDAAILIEGGLQLESVTPVDQFRFAAHVEIVAVFRRT